MERGKIEVTCKTGREELYMTSVIVHYQYWFKKKNPKYWFSYLKRKHKDIAEELKRIGV